MKIASRAWYLKNRDKHLEASREYNAANKDRKRIWTAEWQERNPEKVSEAQRRYRQAHPDKIHQRCQDWYKRNKQGVAKRKKGYFATLSPERQEKIRAANRRYAKENPEGFRVRSLKRKAIKLGVTVRPDKIKEWWETICSVPRVACYYCGDKLPPSELHMEHVIPLARGGSHSVENLYASCAHCNCSKGARLPSEWCKPAQVFLNL